MSGIVIVTCHSEDLVGDKVFTCAIAFHDGTDEVFGYIVVVGEELFCVLWEAVTAVAKAGVVVVCTDTRVETDAFDDGFCVQPFYFCVGVQFVEVADAKGQIGIGKKLHCLGFFCSHEEARDALVELRV